MGGGSSKKRSATQPAEASTSASPGAMADAVSPVSKRACLEQDGSSPPLVYSLEGIV
jgi:hypothetical protein